MSFDKVRQTTGCNLWNTAQRKKSKRSVSNDVETAFLKLFMFENFKNMLEFNHVLAMIAPWNTNNTTHQKLVG